MSFNQYHVTSTPRNVRHIFFIDYNLPVKELWDLINMNLGFWGGRYNPIIPVIDGKISNEYRDLCDCYDPDYVYYSAGVDFNLITSLGFFKTSRIEELINNATLLKGIPSLHLLNLFEGKLTIMSAKDMHNFAYPLMDFFRLNFGFQNTRLAWENNLINKHEIIEIEKGTVDSILPLFAKFNPQNLTELSALNTLNHILTSDSLIFGGESFEIVVAEDNSAKDDILYFWNRRLYECKNVLFVTKPDLDLLLANKNFGKILQNIYHGNIIELVSATVEEKTITEDIIPSFYKIIIGKKIQYKSPKGFPYKVRDGNGFRTYFEQKQSQILVSDSTLYTIPTLSFDFFHGQFISELEIKKSRTIAGQTDDLIYPQQLNLQSIIEDHKCRVTRANRISIIFESKKLEKECKIHLIPFKYVAQSILLRPWINGTVKKTTIDKIVINESGTKLSAFMKLFEDNLDEVDDYVSDKFWVDIFNELCTSQKEVGDTITFEDILNQCVPLLEANEFTFTEKEASPFNLENLKIGLTKTISELCYYKILLKGFKIKCPNCSSQFWYHLNESSEILNCKGCLSDFNFPIEPRFAYKLNDLVKNNFYLPDKKQRDGNFTVIKTLAYLQHSSSRSFKYSPQLNLYKQGASSPFTDLDIFCTINGNLVIGEAKTISSEFKADNNKCLKNLVEISKEIRPDIILLSCYEDQGNGLEKAEKGLKHLFSNWEHIPQIKTIELHSPTYDRFNSARYFYF